MFAPGGPHDPTLHKTLDFRVTKPQFRFQNQRTVFPVFRLGGHDGNRNLAGQQTARTEHFHTAPDRVVLNGVEMMGSTIAVPVVRKANTGRRIGFPQIGHGIQGHACDSIGVEQSTHFVRVQPQL